jgi:serine/threonine protein kinase
MSSDDRVKAGARFRPLMSEMGSSHHPPKPVDPLGAQPGDAFPVRPPGSPDEATVITARPGPGAQPARAPSPYELGKMLAGEQLNHFQLLEYVGGGMGAVFRARDTMLGRIVALKVLSRDQGADEETRRRFQNEAQSAARLDHENIARVYYVGEDRGLNYIVFEFIEGINLRELVEQKRGPLPLVEALSYTLQIARALEHASSREVVHRDIKPSNVLITSEGRAKLVDMGLARLHQVRAGGDDLTASGVTLGTFDYISPEQARDPRCADVRSDIYSLGCTLYYMLTARPPFPEGTVLQKLLQHNSDEPPDPREFNPELPEGLSTLVSRMLAKNPRRRYQSAADLIGDLTLLAEQAGVAASVWGLPLATARPGPPLSFVQRHLPWMVPVALLLAIVGALELFSRAPSPGTEAADVTLVHRPPNATSRPQRERPTKEKETPAEASREASSSREPGDSPDDVPAAPSSPDAMPNSPAAGSQPAQPATEMATAGPSRADATPPDNEVLRPGLLVVSADAHGPQRYSSLRAACSEAKNGDVIELRYNGRRDERPIVLNNLRFTVRAGDGYQPVIVFRPDDIDPLRYPRSMITVAGGRLTMLGVAVELVVPSPQDVPADNWSLFTLERCESLELEACSLTIRNGSDQVAFLHVQAAVGADSMMATDENMPDEPVNIRLENSIARGDGVVVRVSDVEPLNLTWDNGLIVTSDRFLAATGGQIAPRHATRVRLSLRHLTAVVGLGFCQLTNRFDAPYLRETEINLSDSILLSQARQPLVEQDGVDSVSTFQHQFSWNGDRNFYQGFDGDAFWRITDQNDPDESQRLSFLDWVSHWGQQHEFLPSWGEIAWKQLPPVDRPPHTARPAEYALSDVNGNMARDGASDGRDAGLSAAELPSLPDEEPIAATRPVTARVP